MTIAVVGAGIQGCATALELRMRGRDVVLFEQAARPMERASRWNEGKIHLGYVYANDPSLETARTMIRGAMVFHARLARYLDEPLSSADRYSEFIYGVHRDSLLSVDEASAHIARVDALVSEALDAPDSDYLGETRLRASRAITNGESPFDETLVKRAIRTPERAIDPQKLADRLAARVLSDPGIAVVTETPITRIEQTDDGCFRLQDGSARWDGPFDAVVNASWESRLALDESMGHAPDRPWLHRYKLALHGFAVAGADLVPSVTLVLGPFGDVVNLGRGRLYLSWYPVCRIGSTSELLPPDPEETLGEEARESIAAQVIDALSPIIPALHSLDIRPADLTVRGGHIFAWGASDIADRASGLHARHAVGVHSDGGYHSIDTGKYSLAPHYAVGVATRIAGEA